VKDNLRLFEEQIERIARALVGEKLIDALYVSLPVDSIDDGSKMLRRDRSLIEVAAFASNDYSVRRVEQSNF